MTRARHGMTWHGTIWHVMVWYVFGLPFTGFITKACLLAKVAFRYVKYVYLDIGIYH
jgi:hypothetical protein